MDKKRRLSKFKVRSKKKEKSYDEQNKLVVKKNENIINSEYRERLRKTKLEDIRSTADAKFNLFLIHRAEKEKRIALLAEELKNEISDTISFLDETCKYYDEVLEQFSTPEPISVDKFVREIEINVKKVFDIFNGEVHFEADFQQFSTEIGAVETYWQKMQV